MNKRSILLVIGGISLIGSFAYLLRDRFNRNQSGKTTVYKAGVPDQLKESHHDELLENTAMVSEGSQYGVDYFNQLQEEEKQKRES